MIFLGCAPLTVSNMRSSLTPLVKSSNLTDIQENISCENIHWHSRRGRITSKGKNSIMINLSIKNQPDHNITDLLYTGFLGFSRIRCGPDFLNGLMDSRIRWNIFDKNAKFLPMFIAKEKSLGKTHVILQARIYNK